MPARTNDFQKMVRRMYRQMVGQGAKVTESAMLPERGTGTLREVDILVEQVIAGHTFRMAIECRSHGRQSDIIWIDGLIGKYRDLDVQKIVAVSSSGFSTSAREKAKANAIDTCTLRKAKDIDWPSEFITLLTGLSMRNDRLIEIQFLLDRPTDSILTGEEAVFDDEGTELSSLKTMWESYLKVYVQPKIDEQFFARITALVQARSELRETINVEVPLELGRNLYLIEGSGKIRIIALNYRTESRFEFIYPKTSRYMYDAPNSNTGVTFVEFDEHGIQGKLMITQNAPLPVK